MICPYCASTMMEGYLQSSRSLVWCQDELEGMIFPTKETGGFFVTRGIFKKNSIVAHYCVPCKLLLTFLNKP